MEPAKSIFKPINHLINPQILDKYQCIICTQKSISLLQCKTCKNCLCNQCAIDQKQKNNACPFRCTEGELQLQILSDLDLKFSCPFSPQCKCVIKSVKQFYEHDRQCKFISQYHKQQQRKKWHFKCQNNHPLQVYMDKFQMMITRKKCHSCGQFGISRVICRKCDHFYCRYCRPFPIFNNKCPIGHQLIKRQIMSKSYICDICQLSAAMIGLAIYDDHCCNIGICENCFKGWPKFQVSIQHSENLSHYCDLAGFSDIKNSLKKEQYQNFKQQHKLVLLPSLTLQNCDWCSKQKLCFRKCKKCEKYYCLQCKMFNVVPDGQFGQCQLGHPFSPIQIPYGQTISCYRCRKVLDQSENAWTESQCKIVLCLECLEYSHSFYESVTERKIFPEDKNCLAQNHICYHSSNNYKSVCGGCKKQKYTKIYCTHCSPQNRYCCACLPTKNPQNCYCRKKLQKTNQINNAYCLTCDKINPQSTYGCLRCAYTICQGCIEKRKINEKQKQQEKKEIKNKQAMEKNQEKQLIQ